MVLVIGFDLVVGRPDGGPAGGLGRHHVDAAAELHGEIRDTGADEFHHLILHKTVLEYRADDRQRDVLRSDPGARRSGEIDGDDIRAREIIGTPD